MADQHQLFLLTQLAFNLTTHLTNMQHIQVFFSLFFKCHCSANSTVHTFNCSWNRLSYYMDSTTVFCMTWLNNPHVLHECSFLFPFVGDKDRRKYHNQNVVGFFSHCYHKMQSKKLAKLSKHQLFSVN